MVSANAGFISIHLQSSTIASPIVADLRIRAGLLGGGVWLADGAELLLIGSASWLHQHS